MAERNVGPADCAIGVGVPLSREDFLAGLADGARDFARSFRDHHLPGAGPELVWKTYAPRAAHVAEMLADVAGNGRWPWPFRKAGVRVIPRLTLDDLRRALETHHVVTVMTHMALPRAVRPHEVVNPDLVASRVRTGTGLVHEEIRRQCPELAAAAAGGAALAADHVATLLTGVIRRSRGIVGPDGAADGNPLLDRLDLEDALSPGLTEAPIVELSDGLKTWRDLLSAVPEEFDGVLDLSLCNSRGLGEALRRRRAKCLVVINRGSADLTFRALFYRSVVAALRAKPQRFTDVVLQLHGALMEELCKP